MAASDDLKAQVESLQETVSAQQDRIDQLEPDTDGVSRRGVLAGLAGVAGFGAAIPYMSQPAAAQAVGQIGSPTERVDVYGSTGDFDAIEASSIRNTNLPESLGDFSPNSFMASEDELLFMESANALDPDSSVTKSKQLAWFWDSEGKKRLSSWSPAEVKGSNNDVVEWSAYMRSVPVSQDSQEHEKWFNINNNTPNYYFNVDYRNLDSFAFNTPGGGNDTLINYWVKDDSTDSEVGQITQRYRAADGIDFEIRYTPEFGELRLISGGNSVLVWGDGETKLEGPIRGLREVNDPSVTDLAGGEWAWDATNLRWVFRDYNNTGHYFTPDGTF